MKASIPVPWVAYRALRFNTPRSNGHEITKYDLLARHTTCRLFSTRPIMLLNLVVRQNKIYVCFRFVVSLPQWVGRKFILFFVTSTNR